MRVLASTGLKGGVGKTSTAVNLAALAATSGHRTLVLDLDPQGAATYCLHRRPRRTERSGGALGGSRSLARLSRDTPVERLDVVPADLSLRAADRLLAGKARPVRAVRRVLAGAGERYDVVVLDCPAGMGTLIEVVASIADVLLVPVVPAPLAMRAFDRYADFLSGVQGAAADSLAPFLSMVDRRKPLHRRVQDDARADRRFLATAIPESSSIERMAEARRPSVLTAPRSLSSAAYRQLWSEAAERADLRRAAIA